MTQEVPFNLYYAMIPLFRVFLSQFYIYLSIIIFIPMKLKVSYLLVELTNKKTVPFSAFTIVITKNKAVSEIWRTD